MTRYLGEPVTGTERLAGYVGNQDFMIHTAGGDFVLKAGDRQLLTAEAWACERVRAAGVAAPDVVALDVDQRALPSSFLLMRRMAGAGLSAGRHPALVEAGRQLRRVHSIPMTGYGFLAGEKDAADGLVGPHPTWAGFTGEADACLDELVVHQVVSGGLADRLQKVVHERRDAVRFDGPGVLLHGDLKPPHVFADAGRFVGIIDWGDAACGDPLYDLGRLSLAGPDALSMLLTGYGLDLDDDLRTTFAVYRLIRMTTILRDELRAGGDWFATYRAAIESDLQELAR
jgi:aminoglycoside phosphotransferase (APT) family kinase protein